MGWFRFLLALSVVIVHTGGIYGYHLLPGNTAIEAFFIISGFYMAMILNEKYNVSNGGYKLFITNRLMRIYPTYWIILAFTFITSILLLQFGGSGVLSFYREHFGNLNLFGGIYMIVANILVIGQDLILFFKLNTNGSFSFSAEPFSANIKLYNFLIIQPAWTLSLELMFYLLAPFIIKLNKGFLFCIVICLMLVKEVARAKGLDYDPWIYRFFPFELMWFILGTLSYSLYKREALGVRNKPFGRIMFLLIMLFTFAYSFVEQIPAIGYLYLIVVALAIPSLFNFFKKSNIDRYVGELSFPLYLSHWIIVQVFQYLGARFGFNQNALALLTILSSIAFSSAFVFLIGKRIEDYRRARYLKLGKNSV